MSEVPRGQDRALADLPWMPLYLAICFAFHPLIGMTARSAPSSMGDDPHRGANARVGRRRRGRGEAEHLAEASRRNAEVLRHGDDAGSPGAGASPTKTSWRNQRACDVAGGLGALSRCAADAAVGGSRRRRVSGHPPEATAGIIIAASILTARALAPVDSPSPSGRDSSQRARAARFSQLLEPIPAAAADSAAGPSASEGRARQLAPPGGSG